VNVHFTEAATWSGIGAPHFVRANARTIVDITKLFSLLLSLFLCYKKGTQDNTEIKLK
jgi:hypothetical protein